MHPTFRQEMGWLPRIMLLCALVLASCGPSQVGTATPALPTDAPTLTPTSMGDLIPLPVSASPAEGNFTFSDQTDIFVDPGNEELLAIGQYLTDRLNPATGYDIRVLTSEKGIYPDNIILLSLRGADPSLGDEGYELTIRSDFVTLQAKQPAGLFHGVQTLRQLLPPAIESASPQTGPWQIPAGKIVDSPRFPWRGAMLDVSRHFFTVREVTRYIDLLAYYKINILHLHLSDDQGWRIEIKSWPNLTAFGSNQEVGGTPGGYYSQDDYTYLVNYALSRYITIVPEIDMPGHTNAALASYPELNCDNQAPDLYTGMDVGFSSLCINKEITYEFIDDVVSEISALTPGPYFHVGGDEAHSTSEADYKLFMERVKTIVKEHGKQMVGFEEIAAIQLLPDSIPQHWNPGEGLALEAAEQDLKIIMSPADKAYLDMKYDRSTKLGATWAGYIDVQTAYDWDPAALIDGIVEKNILGVEAPLWSETLLTLEDIEFMAFPRLPGYAEMGWSPQAGRNWEEYSQRLATHGIRWDILEINYFRSPEIPWK